jgi:hypothetical protein
MTKIRDMIDSLVNDDFDSARNSLKTVVAEFMTAENKPTDTQENSLTDDTTSVEGTESE